MCISLKLAKMKFGGIGLSWKHREQVYEKKGRQATNRQNFCSESSRFGQPCVSRNLICRRPRKQRQNNEFLEMKGIAWKI